MSGPMIQTGSRPSVRIGEASRVVIGTGKARVTVESAPVAEWRGPRQQLAVEAPARQVIVGGRQGIAGPPGEGIEIERYLAAVALGGHRAVALDASGSLVYASASLGIAAIGIIRDAVAAGEPVVVYRRGRIGGFAGLTPAAVYYLAASGLLSLTPALSGVLQPLGTAVSGTELIVDPDYPTFLT